MKKFVLNYIEKIKKRYYCKHLIYQEINCYHTGIFMYHKCVECGKKKIIL